MKQLVLVLVSTCVLGVPAVAAAGGAIDKPAFTATPAELLAAAKAVPRDDWPVAVMREDYDVSFDERGRETHRWRMVLVVRNQSGVDDWGTLSWPWSPFYQDKPTVRARVIQPDGTSVNLDPSVVSDAPLVEKSSSVFSDRRKLNVPLPQMQIGAVVEEEIVVVDREPIVASFGEAIVWPGNYTPTASTHVMLSAPQASKAHMVARGLDPKVRPRHDIKGGRETWMFELGVQPAASDRERSVPGDVIVDPRIGIATAPSWGVLSKEYRKVIDKRIADGAFALPAELPRAPSLETVNAITAWLHARIRYTGIEFGEASNIPWPPAETVKRGFGDCKDKATLLVALLRQAGIRADLALLYDGPGRDIDVDLPGLSVFDHAIVRAKIGATDIWIDATEDQVPAGKLPIRDQARRTLIIADDTTALIATPRFNDNAVREVRTYEVAEEGAAKVTEVVSSTGAYGAVERTWVRDTRSEQARKDLTEYVRSEYKAKALGEYKTSSVSDLDHPFQMTITATGAERVFTARDHIDIYLFPTDVLAKCPAVFTEKPDADEKPRRHDYEWPIPHVYEIEARIVLPPGFEPPPIDPLRARKLGAATFTEERKVDKDTLIVIYRFDSGKQRLTPVELAETRTAIRELSAEELHLVSSHRAWAMMAKGQVKQAVAEAQRLIKLHPKEARHHTELATMYLLASAGSAARREAAVAVQLEPKSADPYVVQGWILSHDTLGREYGFDHDHAGALAAYTKARALDTTHIGAAAELAGLLERDPDGRMAIAPAQLAAAAEAWRAATKLGTSAEYTHALIRVLLRDNKAAEAENVARAAPVSATRDALLVAAVAAGSAQAGINLATTMRSGNDRTTLITTAAGELVVLRHYAAAIALRLEAGTARPGGVDTMLFQKMRRHDEPLVIGKDPRKVVVDLMLVILDELHTASSFWDDTVRDDVRQSMNAFRKQLAAARRLGTAAIRDLVMSGIEPRVEGPPTGPWRVTTELFGQKFVVYVGLKGNEAKLLGSPDSPRGVGRLALQRIEARDAATARQLMDWLHTDLAQFVPGSRLLDAWGGTVPRDDKALAVAASITASGSAGERLIPVLAKCESPAKDVRATCDRALKLVLYETKRWKDLEQHAIAWQAREPTSIEPLKVRLGTLIELKRYDEAETLAGTLSKDPNDHDMLSYLAQLAAQRGAIEDAVRRYDGLVKSASGIAMDKNNFAWFLLAAHRDPKLSLELANAALREMTNETVLNTVSTIEIDQGDLQAGMNHTLKAMEARGDRRPQDLDWFVIGRLHEHLGLRDDAISAYRRIDRKAPRFGSAGAMAVDRLKVLGAP